MQKSEIISREREIAENGVIQREGREHRKWKESGESRDNAENRR